MFAKTCRSTSAPGQRREAPRPDNRHQPELLIAWHCEAKLLGPLGTRLRMHKKSEPPPPIHSTARGST